MSKKFKPMLGASAVKDEVAFPCYASTKLDGIRGLIGYSEELVARSLKPIGSLALQERYGELNRNCLEQGIILDGEFFSPDLTFGEISSFVRSSSKQPPDHLEFYVFDVFEKEYPTTIFRDRRAQYYTLANIFDLKFLEQKPVDNLDQVDELFKAELERGNEGLILRNPNSPYKFGRSTVNEGGLLKVKPFETFDAKVIGVIERMENTSESEKNELGNSFKHRRQEDMVPTGIAAAFVVLYEDKELKVTLTGDVAFRTNIWENRDQLLGKMIEYKGMLVGAKDLPRHPTFIRYREDRD